MSGPLSAKTDDELIADANRGGTAGYAAFEQLYRRYRDWVMNLALRFTRDRDLAADVTQEVFLYFLRKFPGFTLTARLTTFLYPAVKNLALAHRQKGLRFTGNDDALAAAPAASCNDDGVSDGEAGSSRAELRAVMESLSDGHREVLLLRFVDDLSLQEIADALNLPLGTVKSRMHNALACLRGDARVKKYFDVE
jgi:RNA polymerase sigma-70 factor (ECF subfamily)